MIPAIRTIALSAVISATGFSAIGPAAAQSSTTILPTMEVVRANSIRESITAEHVRVPQKVIAPNEVVICLTNLTGGARTLVNSSTYAPSMTVGAGGTQCLTYGATLQMNFGGRDEARPVTFANKAHVGWSLGQYGGGTINFIWRP